MMRWLIKHTLLKSPTMVIASPQEMLVTLSAILCLHIFAHIWTYFHFLHISAHICTYLHIFVHICTYLHIFAGIFAHICRHFYIFATFFFHCVSSHWPVTPPQPVDKGFNYDQGHHVWHCLRVIFAIISDKKHPRHSLNHHYHGLVLVGLSCRIILSSLPRPSLTIFTMRSFTCWT